MLTMLTLRRRDSRKLLWLFPALSIMLGGCVTTGDTEDSNLLATLSPEERQMREDATVFRNTVLGGAVVWGGLTAGLCILEYGTENLEECAKKAMIIAIAGAIDGYLAAKKQEASRKKVREIDLITEEIEERNAGIEKMVESSHKVVEQNRTRIEEVKQQVAQNEVQEDRLAEEKKRIEANIDVMDKTIATLIKDKATYEVAADKLEQKGENVADLRSRVDSMSLQIAALEQERDALEEINQTVRIG